MDSETYPVSEELASTWYVPMARLGLPEEMADSIVFIASDEGRFITGHSFNVDGGLSTA